MKHFAKDFAKSFAILLIAFSVLAFGGRGGNFLIAKIPKVNNSNTPICKQGAPHPASVVNFLTIAGCWDFTQQSQTNLIVNHSSSVMVYTTLSNWLGCAGASSPIWDLNNVGVGGNSCPAFSIVNDPTAGSNVLKIHADPSLTAGTIPSMATANSSGTTNFSTYPVVNSVFVIRWRSDTSQIPNNIGVGSNSPAWMAFWSWYVTGGFEIDFLERFGSNIGDTALLDWNAGGVVGPKYQWTYANDSAYHTMWVLTTSNGSSGQIGLCTYIDGAAVANCAGKTPSVSTEYTQNSYLVLWNAAAQFGQTTGTGVDLFIEYMQVWSCAGFQTGTPNNPSNTCTTASPYTSGTPP